MPGPRDPAPIPPTGEEGYVAIPSEDDAAASALAEPADPGPGRNGTPGPALPPQGGTLISDRAPRGVA